MMPLTLKLGLYPEQACLGPVLLHRSLQGPLLGLYMPFAILFIKVVTYPLRLKGRYRRYNVSLCWLHHTRLAG